VFVASDHRDRANRMETAKRTKEFVEKRERRWTNW
jgi:hypothetical protein